MSSIGALRVCWFAPLADEISRMVHSGDLAVVSVHCGLNWGYEISDEVRSFAHHLIDVAPISVLHFHSSHHSKGIEVYCDRLGLYGCGDFINDYEGIPGHEDYRDDLALMYFAEIEAGSGVLLAVEMMSSRV